MVAWAAVEKFNLGRSDVIEGQDVYPRWPIGNTVPEFGREMEDLLKKKSNKVKS